MKTILKNGRILDPSQNMDIIGSVVIEDDCIVEVGAIVDGTGAEEIYDCTGMWITPGLVDPHAHLREPGEDHKESIITGTKAAAAGGFTTICCMPNTSPRLDRPQLIDFILDRAASAEAGGIFVAPVGALTRDGYPNQISDLAALKKAGIVAASDEGDPIQDSRLMTQAMEFCRQLDIPIMAHCEDRSLTMGGVMNDGPTSSLLGLKGMPRSAEEIMVMRNCLLALHTGCSVHILRVSTWGAIEMIRQAKYLGAPVTCEVCPQYLIFTDEDVAEFDPRFKTTPPFRTQIDIDILNQALADGTVDCLASDHSPHAAYEVLVPFEEAPFGMPGLETMLGATLTHLTHKGIISPLDTVRKLSTAPAQILRLDAGSLKPGETPVAQVTVIDPDCEWTFDARHAATKAKLSPFDGMKFKGKAMLTFCGGEVYYDGHFGADRYETFD
ncbi:MAG: dihydroorotase [Armatimonadetes bacterium]|nr:dihydroorotase [Armatimonadota bacterium]